MNIKKDFKTKYNMCKTYQKDGLVLKFYKHRVRKVDLESL